MLPKAMMKFRRNGNSIKPVFIDTAEPGLLEYAGQLVGLYSMPDNPEDVLTRGELDEMSEPLIKSQRDAKFAAGLHKLMTDRCEFSAPVDLDYSAMRRDIFSKSALLLKEAACDLDDYRKQLLSDYPDAIEQGIYRDLPQNEKLCKVRKTFAGELLERYNCAQVQSLLLYTSEIDLRIEEHNPASVRKLFKYLKFFRLLAEIHQLPMSGKEKKDGTFFRLALKISGPVSLFENTRKYALQLASFFPAVCDIEKWTLIAGIELDKRQSRLRLTQEDGLVGHYRNFSAYVPEEITMFHRLFREKSLDWEITGDSPFFNLGNQELIFPDLSFRHPSGRVVHLELFHRWHSSQLLSRLEAMKEKPEPDLIIGIDRSLCGENTKELLERSEFFNKQGYLFRDFPGVDRTLKLLNELIQ